MLRRSADPPFFVSTPTLAIVGDVDRLDWIEWSDARAYYYPEALISGRRQLIFQAGYRFIRDCEV
jgi:hypothetical protein